MAKAKKTEADGDKSPKEASELFHNIIKASVSGNPKPKKKDGAGEKSLEKKKNKK